MPKHKKVVAIYIDEELLKKLKDIAQKQERSLCYVVEKMLEKESKK